MHLSQIPPGYLTSYSSSLSNDGATIMTEQGLTQAFQLRRNRMEAASRLTGIMMEQIASVVASDENRAHLAMFDTVVHTTKVGNVHDKTEVTDQEWLGDDTASFETVAKSWSSDNFLSDEINQKLCKLCEMRVEQHNAADLNIKPAFQSTEPEMTFVTPPDKFTSTSFAFALEAFSVSVSKLVSASDRILVELSMLDKSTKPRIFKELKILSLHSKHACRCYAAVMQHFKQYELCRKATQDAIAQEMAGIREGFLIHKEMLTTQEQKQKVAEEHSLALRNRLINIEAMCRMWLAVLQEFTSQIPLVLSSMLVSLRGVSSSRGHESSVSQVSLSRTRAGSLAKNTSRTGSLVSIGRPTMCAQSPILNEGTSSETTHGSDEDVSGSFDVMEAKVSQFWANPYVMKAQQYTERHHRRQCLPRERASTIADSLCISTVNACETGPAPGSSMRYTTDAARVSRCGSLYKPPAAPETAEKAAAEGRLVSLLRDLLRLVLGVNKQGEVPPSVLMSKGEISDVTDRDSEKNSIFTLGSIEDSRVLAPTIVAFEMETDEATNAMLGSIRNLIRFFEDGRSSPA